MAPARSAVVTGAMSYIGSAVAASLARRGWQLRTLTNRTRPLDPGQAPLPAAPLQFVDRGALVDFLRGARLLVNTYWVRYPAHGVDFSQAVANSATLFQAAAAAGVERVVQVSVSNASLASPLPYYRGKAEVEELLKGVGPSWAVVRPTWVVGERDILLNNVAWFLRRFPLFALPGSGAWRVQPITLADCGEVVAAVAEGGEQVVVDAAGPEVLSFAEVVRAVADRLGLRRAIVRWPPGLVLAFLSVAGRLLGDLVLTREEVAGLAAELLVSRRPATGVTPFSQWLAAHGGALGASYQSEWRRHFAELDLGLVVPRD